MSKRVQVALAGLVCFMLGLMTAQSLPLVYGQEKGKAADTKAPKWLHGLDLRCRKGGEPDFTPKTQKFGIEVFRDENNGNLIYISETGSIGVVSGK
jgi:hypothetical protein